jgi:hypothetical protein
LQNNRVPAFRLCKKKQFHEFATNSEKKLGSILALNPGIPHIHQSIDGNSDAEMGETGQLTISAAGRHR